MDPTNGRAIDPAQLDQLAINTVRFLSVDAVQKANSGHPGLPLGAAPMAYVLWTRFLRHNPANPHWFNRDRFVHPDKGIVRIPVERAMDLIAQRGLPAAPAGKTK